MLVLPNQHQLASAELPGLPQVAFRGDLHNEPFGPQYGDTYS
jgi:hypothetical protein